MTDSKIIPPQGAHTCLRQALEAEKELLLKKREVHDWRPKTPEWDRCFGELSGLNRAIELLNAHDAAPAAQTPSACREALDLKAIEQSLIGAANLIDVIKTEWEPTGDWSEWDAVVRKRITASLAALAAQRETEERSQAGSSPELEAILKDPAAVHLNMLRGGIAMPSLENIKHLYPEVRDAFAAVEEQKTTAGKIVHKLHAERDQATRDVVALEREVIRLQAALRSVATQCGNVIYNCEQRPADNERHLSSWRGVKDFAEGSCSVPSTSKTCGGDRHG